MIGAAWGLFLTDERARPPQLVECRVDQLDARQMFVSRHHTIPMFPTNGIPFSVFRISSKVSESSLGQRRKTTIASPPLELHS
jgi:hypothetical protein